MSNLRQAAEQALEAWDDPLKDLKDLCVAMDALRKALEQQAEPVATHRITAWGHCGVCRHDRIPGEGCARQECPDSPQRKRFDILVITTAYEQGVGKGHQAHGRSVEIENPYAPGECQQAWALGYDEGKDQAASKAAHGIKGEA